MFTYVNFLRTHQEILIFFALASGYLIGKIKIFGFSLGTTASVLIVSLILGQLRVHTPIILQNIAFALFIYSIGYKVGPEFFGALKKDGGGIVMLAIIVSSVGLITTYILSKLFGFDAGTAAGLLGGAMTQSSVVGTATHAIHELMINNAQKIQLQNNVAVAYAVTYIFGTLGLILFYKILPKIFNINMKIAAKKLEKMMHENNHSQEQNNQNNKTDGLKWDKKIEPRWYKIANSKFFGKKISTIQNLLGKNAIIFMIRRNGKDFVAKPNNIIQKSDLISLKNTTAHYSISKVLEPVINATVIQKKTDNMKTSSLCIINKDLINKTLGSISQKYGNGCFLKKVLRQDQEIPITKNTVIKKCDTFTLVGDKENIEKLVKTVGYEKEEVRKTDFAVFSLGCFLGILIGFISINIAGVSISLGAGGGTLIAGLIFGWLRSVHPTFGRLPNSVQWAFSDLGLNLFIACVGLTAGYSALKAISTTGGYLLFSGFVVTLLPAISGLLFGYFVLKLNPILLFGASTGAETATASLNAIKEESDSSLPAIGYTIPYAVSSVILTICGAFIVCVIHL